MGRIYIIAKVSDSIFNSATFDYIQQNGTILGSNGNAVWKMITNGDVSFAIYGTSPLGWILKSENVAKVKGCWTLASGNVYTQNVNSVVSGYAGYYYFAEPSTIRETINEKYSIYEEAFNAISTPNIPITYYLTNCSAPSAPASVSPGGVVTFPVTVSPGYNIFNPVQGGSISVYQGDDYIPFTYENGVLRFTAPGGG